MFNDFWMADQGFLQKPRLGDLRDLVSRRFDEGAAVVLSPDDTLNTAWARMKLYDISQLPVVEGDRPVGIIDESDLLLAVVDEPRHFSQPVRSAMHTALETVPVGAGIPELLAIFNKGYVAVVVDGPHFIGLITRIDLINHLRRKVD
jgi:cystathionine beta-synthase